MPNINIGKKFERLETLIKEGFVRMDRRFKGVDRRFNGTNKRFTGIDRRFDKVDSRFDTIDGKFNAIDGKFNALDGKFIAIDGKFKTIDERFDRIRTEITDDVGRMVKQGFDHVDKRFTDLEQRFDHVDYDLGSANRRLHRAVYQPELHQLETRVTTLERRSRLRRP